jgi:hypothetical protein
MENEDESVNTDKADEEGPVQQKNHGFTTHSDKRSCGSIQIRIMILGQ